MNARGENVILKPLDDLFETDASREQAAKEHVEQIRLSDLHPFKNHPFKVLDDEAMEKTVESVREFGVMVPAIARPREEGGFELISGHRRHHASGLAGLETMPVIVRQMDDDAATILMVDSNLQREQILPSERAFAYKMKLEAIKHQGIKGEITSPQVGEKSNWSVSQVANEANDSRSQVQRYIRLTELIPELLNMVDERKLAFNPAVELSFLKPEEQTEFLEAMEYGQATPSLSQAQRLKKLSQDGKCTLEAMCAVMSEEKKSDLDHVTIKQDVLKRYFPKSYTPKQMEDTIIKLLDQWQKKRERMQETSL
ncbi:MAG: ParB/RepB/Spo0J family partition protein [Lachnospiraceae bacterium]|nr:ParB/RepB/Spo0J family partition protein [Lachnospiraceae bacterium]